MIKFLINRPIAVIMSFTAFFVLGIITYFAIPVSLLPDIDIPEITVRMEGRSVSARELENSVVSKLRRELMQVGGIRDIRSETRDENAVIRLSFNYDANINLATIEVNEKIDAAMSRLPRETSRPRVVRSRASDIPVFNMCLTFKDDRQFAVSEDEERFLQLSEFSETVIKRRLEQLPQIAMIDITGVRSSEVEVIADKNKMDLLGLGMQDIERLLSNHNTEPGSMRIKEGYYEYDIRFSSVSRSVNDIAGIYVNHEGRIMRLRDFAEVRLKGSDNSGMAIVNGKPAVIMGVIKHGNYSMENMKSALSEVISGFEQEFENVEFTIMQNQTELLDYTISNLKWNLLTGFLLICLVALIFLGDPRSPIVICGSMFVSLVISLLFFYLFGISLNIISISGLILALGMMIDSSIIVTDNIAQYRESGLSLEDSCIKGTNEVITPMLSSSFTTIAVFVPLIFMSGIAGALFFDQAFAITVGLLVSYVCGIMLLPVLYKLSYSAKKRDSKVTSILISLSCKVEKRLVCFYDRGIEIVFGHKKLSYLFVVSMLPVCVLFFMLIPKSKMPELDRSEMTVNIDWNENIHAEENTERINALMKYLYDDIDDYSSLIGRQQFVLNRKREMEPSETEIYIKCADNAKVDMVTEKLKSYMSDRYPECVVSVAPPPNLFERIFTTGEADLDIELYKKSNTGITVEEIKQLKGEIEERCAITFSEIPFSDQYNVCMNIPRMMTYNVSQDQIIKSMRSSFRQYNVATLRSHTQYLPVYLGYEKADLDDVLYNTLIPTNTGEKVPLSDFIMLEPKQDIKSVTGGKQGEYIPLSVMKIKDENKVVGEVRDVVRNRKDWDAGFSGAVFSNRKMINELAIVLMVSVLMMYFILCAQFESFIQPFIVLIEIPIDIAAALLLLYVTGNSLNLMSAIGIIVSCGIIINDSILKIDIINTLVKEGRHVEDAIHIAGHRRLRSILMTSLTTILAMVPMLFTSDLGSELQKPLAIASIGAMAVGTLVSLFIIPVIYRFIERKRCI